MLFDRRGEMKIALVLLIIVAFAAAIRLDAQQNVTASALSGTVTDPAGAAVAGATVTIAYAGTGRVQTVSTDDAGRYLFNYVPVGEYRLKVEKEGFRAR